MEKIIEKFSKLVRKQMDENIKREQKALKKMFVNAGKKTTFDGIGGFIKK